MAVMTDQQTGDPKVGDILRAAGLSTKAFYRHFPTKEDLLIAIIERKRQTTSLYIEKKMKDLDDPIERIEAWVRALFDAVRHPKDLSQNRPLLLAHPRLLQTFPTEMRAGFDEAILPLSAAIREARRQKGLPAGDSGLDARLAMQQVYAVLVESAAQDLPPGQDLIESVVAYTVRAAAGSVT
ncbi:MAG: TetR/AcrR family transcriptional regulator [Actinomycetota bacterium]|nr:TetR/AcrR family transcriptional regulator [Actinomycetota bacterium]